MALALGRHSLLMKLYIAMGVVTLPLLLLHPLYVLPLVRKQLHDDRNRTMQQVVETAYGVLVAYEERVRRGELTTAQAQAEAARLLQGMRYGENEYFWVNDLEPRLVMHPHLPKMVGTNMKDYKDAHGNAVFMQIAEQARARGAAHIAYYATRPGESAPLLKQSYVKLFAPWNWVVGTGIYVEDIDKEVALLQQRLLMAMAAALVLVGLVGLAFSRRVVHPVRAMADAAHRVARGDLGFTVPVNSQDEVGRLGEAFNTMVAGIRETVHGMAAVAVSTVADADRIRHSADILSQATREQSDQLQRLADAVQDMSRDLSQGAQRALSTAEAAANNGRVAQEGGETVEHASQKISEIVQVVQRSAQMVARLQASSEVVSQMLRLIQDVSNETNILAVNTAIEAARAGEHGKGFGVVASEVRKLAHRSREAVQQIEFLLKQNHEDTSATASLMRQGTIKVEEGMRLSSATGEALSRIVTGVREIYTKVGDMATEGSRQSNAGENIAERIKALSINSMEAVAGVEQIAQAVVDLHAQAQQLWALAERFSEQDPRRK